METKYESKYVQQTPLQCKENILEAYPGEDYPYVKAFISSFEKYSDQKRAKGFVGDGNSIIAPSKFDKNIFIKLQDKTSLSDFWFDFGAWKGEQEAEYERLSITLGFYPSYFNNKGSTWYDDNKFLFDGIEKFKHIRRNHLINFKEILILEYPEISKSYIKFEGQKHDKQIHECEPYIKLENENLENLQLNGLTKKILDEYNILTFQKQYKK